MREIGLIMIMLPIHEAETCHMYLIRYLRVIFIKVVWILWLAVLFVLIQWCVFTYLPNNKVPVDQVKIHLVSYKCLFVITKNMSYPTKYPFIDVLWEVWVDTKCILTWSTGTLLFDRYVNTHHWIRTNRTTTQRI
jgi:hypothetical protein